ncbi:translation initiation factor EIF-2B subunit, putative [Plasmodium ovale wallikeri]|uniref:Translation initiation factor EIF-2B subunit, putative n=1 Tax=Plasmodium ovale wallikeri TaxID=864142 RepID=A0A1A8ZCG1_PLAOA|nr:translation initiation factor EIF-2B subunit, putative [Plasmodium ovale wallikeri]
MHIFPPQLQPLLQGKSKRYMFEVEKYEEEHFEKDEDVLLRKIVYLFKESMYYFMSFNEKDGQILEKSRKKTDKKDIKDNSGYELLKSLNDCIVQLHDSKKKKKQALIMTSEFCGIFTPVYVKLTKYSEAFMNMLKENNVHYYDLFYEEIKNNEYYKKKKEHYDNLKNSSFVPMTKGEISLANKKIIPKGTVLMKQNDDNIVHRKIMEQSASFNIENSCKSKGDGNLGAEELRRNDEGEKGKKIGKTGEKVGKTGGKIGKTGEKVGKTGEKVGKKRNNSDNLGGEKKQFNQEENTIDGKHSNCGDGEKKKKKKRKKGEDTEKDVERKEETHKEKSSLCKNASREKTESANEVELGLVLYENQDICNYLNIKNERRETDGKNEYADFNSTNEGFVNNAKIFNMLNKQVNSDEYIYNEMKNDFMKEINLPNNFNYDVNVVEICEKDVKHFYRCVVKYINRRKDKIKIYYIICNFLFFLSKMHKNTINFDDNVHKDINRNFDYKSIHIQGNILPYNFFLLLKGLHYMSRYNVIKNFYMNIEYDERKNKCLHFLNITENKFYENFKKFEKNIKTNFMHVHKFLQNMIPINKFLISNGKLYKNSEYMPFSFDDNDFLQLTYDGPAYDGPAYDGPACDGPAYQNKDAIVLYEGDDTCEDTTLGGDKFGQHSAALPTSQKYDRAGSESGSESRIRSRHRSRHRNRSSVHGMRGVNLSPLSEGYIVYDSMDASKGIPNLRKVCTIVNDKEFHKIINDLTDMYDNYTKILLKEKKIIFLLETYEKNTLLQKILINPIFFDSYISLICLHYINTHSKKGQVLKSIPLFKPSYFNLMVNQIKKKKKKKNESKRENSTSEHTVDKLCNNFFKKSINKILNSNGIDKMEGEKGDSLDDVKEETSQVLAPLKQIQDSCEGGGGHGGEGYLRDRGDPGAGTTNGGDIAQAEESTLVINEAVVRKVEPDNVVTCIFILINGSTSTRAPPNGAVVATSVATSVAISVATAVATADGTTGNCAGINLESSPRGGSNQTSEEEKKLRDLVLHVLKKKEIEYSDGEQKYAFKYRNNISDAITLSEIEIRKYHNANIFIVGIVLNNDISNPNLQADINSLYSLNDTLHKKYHAKNFQVQAKIVTFHWIYEVHTYGSIFLRGKEASHLIRSTSGTYHLPYDVRVSES